MIRPPPRSPLFPHPTLSRSLEAQPGRPEPIHLDATVDAQRHREPQLLEDRHHRVGGRNARLRFGAVAVPSALRDRKSTRLNSSHSQISYAVFCLKKKKKKLKPHYNVLSDHQV